MFAILRTILKGILDSSTTNGGKITRRGSSVMGSGSSR